MAHGSRVQNRIRHEWAETAFGFEFDLTALVVLAIHHVLCISRRRLPERILKLVLRLHHRRGPKRGRSLTSS